MIVHSSLTRCDAHDSKITSCVLRRCKVNFQSSWFRTRRKPSSMLKGDPKVGYLATVSTNCFMSPNGFQNPGLKKHLQKRIEQQSQFCRCISIEIRSELARGYRQGWYFWVGPGGMHGGAEATSWQKQGGLDSDLHLSYDWLTIELRKPGLATWENVADLRLTYEIRFGPFKKPKKVTIDLRLSYDWVTMDLRSQFTHRFIVWCSFSFLLLLLLLLLQWNRWKSMKINIPLEDLAIRYR